MKRLICLAVLLCASVALAESTALSTAKKLLAAFNAQDAEAMAALVTDDFELIYVDDAGKGAVALVGPEALKKEMTGYFKALPEVQSEIEGVVDGERFVSFRERIVGGQSSLAVYEIDAGKIRRVWYYPAEH